MTDLERGRELERLMQAYGTDVKRWCCLQLQDAALAEDASQETFLRAYRHLESFRGASSERTWLMRIAWNLCRDYQRAGWFRRHDRRVTVEEVSEQARWDTYADETVWHAVAALPTRLQQAVLLRYWQQMTVREAAEVMRVSESTAKRLLRKAESALRQQLEEWYHDG